MPRQHADVGMEPETRGRKGFSKRIDKGVIQRAQALRHELHVRGRQATEAGLERRLVEALRRFLVAQTRPAGQGDMGLHSSVSVYSDSTK